MCNRFQAPTDSILFNGKGCLQHFPGVADLGANVRCRSASGLLRCSIRRPLRLGPLTDLLRPVGHGPWEDRKPR